MDKRVTNATVSVIIPTYNSYETIAKCLESIAGQTYRFCQTFVIDNFSQDSTLKIVEQFKVCIIQHKSNPALARNVGLANSTAPYILFLDSDQALTPRVVEDCLEKCENQKADMVIIPEVFIGQGFWSICSAEWKNYYQAAEQSETNDRILGEPRFFRRQKLNQAGTFDTSMLWGEDYDLYQRLNEIGAKEISSESEIYHFEPTSLKGMLLKNLRYGKSMPTFLRQTKNEVLRPLLKRAILTMGKITRAFVRRPLIIFGCAFLLVLKIYSVSISFVIGVFHAPKP